MLFVTNGTPLEECRKTHLEAEERGLRKLTAALSGQRGEGAQKYMSRFINPVYEVQNKTIRCGQFVTGVSGRVYNVNNKGYHTTSEKN